MTDPICPQCGNEYDGTTPICDECAFWNEADRGHDERKEK